MSRFSVPYSRRPILLPNTRTVIISNHAVLLSHPVRIDPGDGSSIFVKIGSIKP